MDKRPIEHIPVLAQAIEASVHYPGDAVVVDATLGQGGHSVLLAQRLTEGGRFSGFDIDPNGPRVAGNVWAEPYGRRHHR